MSWKNFKTLCYIFLLQVSILPKGSTNFVIWNLCKIKQQPPPQKFINCENTLWVVFFPLLIFSLNFSRPIDMTAKSKQLDLLVNWIFFHFNIPKTALWPNTFITINTNNIWILKWNFFHPWLMILFYVKLNEDMW